MPIAARDAFTVPADEGFVVALQIGWESIALGTDSPSDRGPGAGHSITGSLAGIAIRSAAEVPSPLFPLPPCHNSARFPEANDRIDV